MSKRALAVVAALLATLWVSAGAPAGQEKAEKPRRGAGTKYAFVPGRFLTADDYAHIGAALSYVDLRPEDLSFDKQVAPGQRFVLPICAECLDNPLGVPRVAEDASDAMSLSRKHAARGQYAAVLLGLPIKRWSIEELRKDSPAGAAIVEANTRRTEIWNRLSRSGKRAAEIEADKDYKEAKAADEKARELMKVEACAALGGGGFEELCSHPATRKLWPNSSYAEFLCTMFYPTSISLQSGSADEKMLAASTAALHLPEEVFNAPAALPGAQKLDPKDDVFEAGSRVLGDGPLVAQLRAALVLEEMAAYWTPFLAARADWKLAGEPASFPGITGGVLGVWKSPLGRIVLGGTGDNVYEGDDFIAIVDLGGNDIYRGRVASGIGLPGKAPLSFVLDLSGNDRYEGEDFTQGFGFNGVGILWDLSAGDDFYKSRFCSQACGLCGYGELYDDGGDDIYIADSGAQGAACFGYGHLIDAAGNDSYRGARFVQAYANCMGVGVLTDGAGNDVYYAGGKYLHQPLHNDHYQSLSQGFSIGNRIDGGGGTGGGVALLLDQGDGNDNYIADIYGQGASYWYSLGMLVDEGGNDNHVLYQYGLGGGIHLSAGILVNLKGNDTYTDPWGVGIGGAHDYAVGWLIDRSGNDLYQGGGQGQGLNFSVGILLDCAGNDSHACNGEGSVGAGHNNDVSLMLDLDGDDFYSVQGVKNGRFTRQGGHGLIYDCPSGGWFQGIDMSTLPTKQDPAPKSAKVQHILISFDGCGLPELKGAKSRSEKEAETLAQRVLKLARAKGADWKQLQIAHNEDSTEIGSNTHADYLVTPDAKFVPEFKECALALGVGQIALSKKSKWGWHIVRRIE